MVLCGRDKGPLFDIDAADRMAEVTTGVGGDAVGANGVLGSVEDVAETATGTKLGLARYEPGEQRGLDVAGEIARATVRVGASNIGHRAREGDAAIELDQVTLRDWAERVDFRTPE